MKSTLTNLKSRSLKQSNTRNAVETLKAVVFGLGNIKLALPIEAIYKVLNQTSVYASAFNGLGLAHVGDHDVTVVDLHRQLFQSSLINEESKARYLVVVQNTQGELYGIPVAAVPVLMEIPLSTIRVLPKSYRHADTLRSATHVCHISQAEEPLTIFMLDVEQLVGIAIV